MPDEPHVIACSLTGTDQADQIERWHRMLSGRSVHRSPRTGQVEIDIERVEELSALVRDEQRCCPFLGFRLDFDGDTVTLTITAPSDEADVFITDLLARTSP